MAKLILEKSNGEQIVLRENISENTIERDVLIKSDYVAMKIWSKEDIAGMLAANSFRNTNENISLIVNSTGIASALKECTDMDWDIISQAIKEVADKLEQQKVSGKPMIFKSAEEMLNIIQSGIDLYNPNTNEYVFVYNDKGSIAVYGIEEWEALELEKKSKESGEYWGAFLGIGGAIWDDPEHDDYVEGNSNLDYCKGTYNQEGWINVTPIDKEENKNE